MADEADEEEKMPEEDGWWYKAIPTTLEGRLRVRCLNLADAGLEQLPRELLECVNLTHLIVCRNRLTSLPPAIGQLRALVWLSLSDNKLTSLPPEIGQLKALVWLFLAHNNLTPGTPMTIQGLQARWATVLAERQAVVAAALPNAIYPALCQFLLEFVC